MKKVIDDNRIPVKFWLDDIEDGAMRQVKNLANLPFAFRHVAIMPDAHQGYGMPIGGVLATTEVIIPNAVGVDIGCGMCALKTDLKEIELETLKRIVGKIRTTIPLGFAHHKEKQSEEAMPKVEGSRYYSEANLKVELPISGQEYQSALRQLGTLGGGNHFIEIQKGSDGFIWLMIHSGSRNIGYTAANYYNKLAVSINERWHTSVPKEWELAFFPIDSIEGRQYIREMEYCVEFALANRKMMMDRIAEIVHAETSGVPNGLDGMINIAHNYAAIENHFGKNVIVHRKGATQAREGQLGIIPGSQGTKSYIVRGKGNPESFQSCSHGAGRKMGRKEAERTLSLEDEKKRLDERGILHAIRGKRDLDEAPGAYKDIDVVMENQRDLVDIEVELTPLAVVKG